MFAEVRLLTEAQRRTSTSLVFAKNADEELPSAMRFLQV